LICVFQTWVPIEQGFSKTGSTGSGIGRKIFYCVFLAKVPSASFSKIFSGEKVLKKGTRLRYRFGILIDFPPKFQRFCDRACSTMKPPSVPASDAEIHPAAMSPLAGMAEFGSAFAIRC
jgi:hypothetical protein